jgi:type IV secretory pathway VirB2 component (pilin)
MKKVSKIVLILVLVMILLSMATSVMATGTDVKPSDMTGTLKGDANQVNVTGITDFGNKIIKIISTIGVVVSVIVLIVLGIKYMMGSAEEKAEYKKTLMPYLIGAGLVFAASSIANIVYNFMQNV